VTRPENSGRIVLIRLQPPLEKGRASVYYFSDREEKIDAGPSPDVTLKDYICEKIDEEVTKGHRRFVIDLGLVKWVSSAEVGMMLLWYRMVTQRNGRLVFANPSPSVKEVMEVTRLDTVVTVVTDLGEAKQLLKK
jgi:anti-anti-sigma factor